MKNKLIKDSFFILLANGLTFITSIIVTKIITVSFSLTDFGLRAQILTIVAVFNSFLSLGLSNAANYFIPLTDNKDGKEWIKVLRNIYIITVPICLLVVVLVLFFSSDIAVYFRNPELDDYRLFIAIMVCEQIVYSLYAGSQIAQHKAIKSTLTNLLRSTFKVLVVGTLCFLQSSIRAVILGSICVDVVFCIFTVADATVFYKRINGWFDIILITDIIKYCMPLGVSLLTGRLCAQINKVFISRLLSLKDLAVYTNMSTELPLAAISGAFIAVITPYVVKLISRGKVVEAVRLWGYIIELVSIVLFPIITLLIVFSKQIITILYSSEYVIGADIFKIFAVLELNRITFFGLILRSYGKSKLILLCSFCTLIINVFLNYIFYFVFDLGMQGFALATLISTLSIQALQLQMSCWLTGIQFTQIFPWRKLVDCGFVNFGFGALVIVISMLFGFYDTFEFDKMLILIILWAVLYIFIEKERFRVIYNKTKEPIS